MLAEAVLPNLPYQGIGDESFFTDWHDMPRLISVKIELAG